MFGDLELTCSAIWRNRVWRFGEIVFGDLEKSCSVIWINRVRRFGEMVFGDFLELTCSAISACLASILEVAWSGV